MELVAGTTIDIKGTTAFVDTTSLTLAGSTMKIKDKSKNKEYDLLKFLSDNSRRLSAIEEKAKDDEGPTTEELSSQIKELWEILQMMQKHYVQLMKKDTSTKTQE